MVPPSCHPILPSLSTSKALPPREAPWLRLRRLRLPLRRRARGARRGGPGPGRLGVRRRDVDAAQGLGVSWDIMGPWDAQGIGENFTKSWLIHDIMAFSWLFQRFKELTLRNKMT